MNYLQRVVNKLFSSSLIISVILLISFHRIPWVLILLWSQLWLISISPNISVVLIFLFFQSIATLQAFRDSHLFRIGLNPFVKHCLQFLLFILSLILTIQVLDIWNYISYHSSFSFYNTL